MKKLDLAKTQFLIDGTSMRFFRRKTVTMLFGKGEPIRPITYPEWRKLQNDYPEEVKADGLRIDDVWTLEEFKR